MYLPADNNCTVPYEQCCTVQYGTSVVVVPEGQTDRQTSQDAPPPSALPYAEVKPASFVSCGNSRPPI